MTPLAYFVIFVLTVAAFQEHTSTPCGLSSSFSAHVMKSTKRFVALYVAPNGTGQVPAIDEVEARSERLRIFSNLCRKLLSTYCVSKTTG